MEGYLDRFTKAIVTDALLEAWPVHWEARAAALEAARPVPGDFLGQATPEELSAQWRRLTEAASACRARAQVSPLELVEQVVTDVLEEQLFTSVSSCHPRPSTAVDSFTSSGEVA